MDRSGGLVKYSLKLLERELKFVFLEKLGNFMKEFKKWAALVKIFTNERLKRYHHSG